MPTRAAGTGGIPHGLMQDRQLLISSVLAHAARWHPRREVVSGAEGDLVHRTDYAGLADRAARLARALVAWGIQPGDRVGTLAWNGHRHLELFYAVCGIGAVLHTVNPRLSDDQVAYVVRHARDRLLFADAAFLPIVDRLRASLPCVEAAIALDDGYEAFIAAHPPAFDWPQFDERSASILCYTSGTTGNPKGVLYSHRSSVLHALGAAQRDAMDIGSTDTVMPITPMYHASGWGLPYVAAMTGAKLVLPGPSNDAATLVGLMNAERVTFASGVPTVWTTILQHIEGGDSPIARPVRALIGGSAIGQPLVELLAARGVRAVHAWGMTELSPIGSVAAPTAEVEALPESERTAVLVKQGRPLFGVEMRILGEDGAPLPHDGAASGALWVRGPWVSSGYLDVEQPALDAEGWFPTGDLATIDRFGFMRITDRAKDVIKSGGEWISSVDLENAAAGHPAVTAAAVIAMRHPKWDERPLMIVQCRPGATVDRAGMRGFLTGKVASWWLPDDVVTIEAMPVSGTGKILKGELRRMFAAHVAAS